MPLTSTVASVDNTDLKLATTLWIKCKGEKSRLLLILQGINYEQGFKTDWYRATVADSDNINSAKGLCFYVVQAQRRTLH